MRQYVIGIDAGGTSVRGILQEATRGTVVRETSLPARADGGPEPLEQLTRQLLEPESAARVEAICAGITKYTRETVRDRWNDAMQQFFPELSAQARIIVPDYAIAFRGAIPEGAGIIVIAGTGSVVYGETEVGVGQRIGGRGWEYGDEGSGAQITTEAVRRTLRALDGLQPITPLNQAVMDCLENSEAGELAERARQRAQTEGRGFLVPLVLARAREGDTEAQNLFAGAAGWLAAFTRSAARRLAFSPERPIVVATVGGLWEAGELLTTPFTLVLRRWFPEAQVVPPVTSPVQGAVGIARLAVGRVAQHIVN